MFHAGIGRAVVKALAQCGAEVIAFSRTQADLDSLKQEVGTKNRLAWQHSSVEWIDRAAFRIFFKGGAK